MKNLGRSPICEIPSHAQSIPAFRFGRNQLCKTVTAEELRAILLLSFIGVCLFSVHSLPNSSLTYTLLKPTAEQHVHQYSPFPFQLSPASPSKSWQHPLADHFLCYTPPPNHFRPLHSLTSNIDYS
jgi:hypothetical protein